MASGKSGFKVRFARVDELSRVSELVRNLQAFQQMKKCPRLPSADDVLQELSHKSQVVGEVLANHNGSFVAVAEDLDRQVESPRDKIIGYMIYSKSFSLEHGLRTYVNSFFIDEQYRRNGLGSKFMNFLKIHSTMIGAKYVDIPVMNDNVNGQKFYKTFGSYLVNEDYLLAARRLNSNEAEL